VHIALPSGILDIPNYLEILSLVSFADMGAVALDTQTVLNLFKDWCILLDAAHVFEVPCASDPSDGRAVTTATFVMPLLSSYKLISLHYVNSF
jgi:hypothetical protein